MNFDGLIHKPIFETVTCIHKWANKLRSLSLGLAVYLLLSSRAVISLNLVTIYSMRAESVQLSLLTILALRYMTGPSHTMPQRLYSITAANYTS
jgi:hypothetical protein